MKKKNNSQFNQHQKGDVTKVLYILYKEIHFHPIQNIISLFSIFPVFQLLFTKIFASSSNILSTNAFPKNDKALLLERDSIYNLLHIRITGFLPTL